jgi:bisphosphoglycerate-dependent phosphoglycerate mutase
MREYTLDQVHIPRMYFQEQPPEFDNKQDYLSEEFKNLSLPVVEQKSDKDDEDQSFVSNNAGPSNAVKRNAELPTPRDPSKRLKNT